MKILLDNSELIFGVAFTVIGLYGVIKSILDRMLAVRLHGTVTDYVKKNQDTYFPLVSFNYEGEEHQMKGANGSKKPKIKVGEAVKIYYRPKNQKNVLVAGNYYDIIYAMASLGLGVLLTLKELNI